MKIAVGVVTFNGADDIDECLESLIGQTLAPVEMAIVDNASSDSTPDRIEKLAKRASANGIASWQELNPSNRGFTHGANQILHRYAGNPTDAELVVLLNQDAFLDEHCLQQFAETFAGDPSMAAAGPKILFPDSATIQYAGGAIEEPRGVGVHIGHHETDTGQYDEPGDTDFVTGAVMALRVSCLAAVGCFDPVFSPGYYEDVELCDRMRGADWTVRYIPRALAWHHESSSFTNRAYRLRLAQRNRLLYLLPRLVEPEFEARFRVAEIDAIDTLLVPDELKALAQACLELLSRLNFFLSLRVADHGEDAGPRCASLLRRIRHRAIDRLIGVER